MTARALEPLERWRSRGGHVTVLGRRLFRIATPGRGAVVLIHGFPTSSYDWSAISPLLGERRVLALDLLGYGLSEKPWPHDYTIAEQCDLLEAWLASENVSEAHVVSHDMGDTVLQELLARRREGRPGFSPRSVLMLNGGIIVERIRPILAQRVLRSRMGAIAARLIGRRAFGRSLHSIAGKRHDEADIDALWELCADQKQVYSGLVRYMDERVKYRERWRSATLGHPYPMKLVWGDKDPISGFDMAEEVARERPATVVVRLEGTGHYPQIEEPERVARELLEWFALHEK